MDEVKRPKGIKARVIISIFAISLVNGLQHVLSPVLSSVRDHYPDISVSMIQMLVTMPMLIAIVFALLTGWIALYISKKKIFLFAAAVSGITGLMPLLSDSFGLLLAARALYGIALGIVISLVTALVADFFDGEERIQVMGVQGASVGAGLMLVTALAGFVGRSDFHYVFYISILGFVAFAVMLFLLPDKPVHREQTGTKKKIRLNRKVWILAAFLFAEGFFIIMFTTNVAMHLAGPLKGDTVAAGTITSVFSAAQIVMGLLLRRITAITKKFTLPVAMFFMAAGYLLMAAFPASFVLLLISAVLCGYSQSVYCAGAMAEVTTLVEPESTPMAASVLTCALCISQFVSPVVINTVCRMVFAETSTTGVYLLGGIGIGLVAAIETIYRKKTK